VAYEIRATPEFREWMQTLSREERESFDTAVNLLKERGPMLGAILLIGGDKHGRRGFYEKLIREADELYRDHLRTLKK
jgi:hypothetical protein